MPSSSTADSRNRPIYPISEAAHYLGTPATTLRAWVRGQRGFRPVLMLPDQRLSILSFTNLVEAHILDSLRRDNRIPMQKIRRAMDYLRRHFRSKHPLVEHTFETDGLDLFVECALATNGCGRPEAGASALLNISRSGQVELRELVRYYLRRIDWDTEGQVARLYLFTRQRGPNEPRTVVVDPKLSFGKPVLAGTGIPTAVVADRFKAGESIEELAADYRRAREEIEEAIRCESQAA